MMTGTWMIYGAYGYTGRLILAEAVARGYRPVVAGRNAQRVEARAEAYHLPARTAALDDAATICQVLHDVATLCP